MQLFLSNYFQLKLLAKMQVIEASDNSQGAKISPQIDEARVQGIISFKNKK